MRYPSCQTVLCCLMLAAPGAACAADQPAQPHARHLQKAEDRLPAPSITQATDQPPPATAVPRPKVEIRPAPPFVPAAAPSAGLTAL